MTRTSIKQIALTTLLVSMACGAVLAEQTASVESSAAVLPYDEVQAADAPYVIFSNLDSTPGNRYNSDSFDAFTIAGNRVSGETERWQAIRFMPKVDAQVKGLDVLDKIGETPVTRGPTGELSKPTTRVALESVKIVPADSVK